MKTLAWLFGIFVCASSAYGQKTVTIEGDIRNMPDTVRFFCAEMKGNGMDVRPEDQEIMVNGKFKTFEFDVTDQVKGQPRGGVIVVSGLSISDDEGLEGGGSFDVDVDGWGEWVDIPLPLD